MFNQKPTDRLILASSSPRRREMLAAVGLKFDVIAADLDETALHQESPRAMVERLAAAKAQVVSQKFPSAWVLAADTTVVIEQEMLGKPGDASEAFLMLQKLSARKHSVFSAFSIINLQREIAHHESHASQVQMAPLSDALISKYITSGEPLDKAGAYAIQGLGACLVESIEGSYTNVVGLNLSATISALRKLGCIE